MKSRLRYSLCCALALFKAVTLGYAQSYEISWFTLGSGGGTSTNEFFALSGTVGQTDTEKMADTEYQIEGGFWAAALPSKPFIPMPPASITNANTNQTVSFTNLIAGTPPFQLQWLLNGVTLPGETNETLTISNAQLFQGGTYSCVIVNELGVTNSAAVLQFNLPPLPPIPMLPPLNDNFAERFTIPLTNSSFSSSNDGATIEPNEPPHAGKLGGSSVWYQWSTHADGIATFRTRGSGFDTLLAVYTNNTLEALTPVAADDDSDAFLTSEVRFNVASNTVYQIAIDGLGGRHGPFSVSWEFLPTPQRLPLILIQPKSHSVRTNATTFFTVGTNQPGLTYQWHFNGNAIPDATSSTLVVSNITESDLGFYYAGVTNITNTVIRGVESRRAALELGPRSNAVSQAKLEDLLFEAGLLTSGGASGNFAAAASLAKSSFINPSGFESVSAGTIDQQRFSTTDAVQPGLCHSCKIAADKTKFYGLTNLDSGLMVIDTAGSNFKTVLTVYGFKSTSAFYSDPCSYLIGCDTNSGADGKSSRLSFQAVASSNYVAEVGGVNGATGNVVLNWQLAPPSTPFEYSGSELYLVTATNRSLYSYDPRYYWRSNGFSFGEPTTVPRLFLGGPPSQASTYTVVMNILNTSGNLVSLTNDLGTIVTAASELDASRSFLWLKLEGLTHTNFQVETATSTNTTTAWQWKTVTSAISVTKQTNRVIVSIPTSEGGKFFRVRPKTR